LPYKTYNKITENQKDFEFAKFPAISSKYGPIKNPASYTDGALRGVPARKGSDQQSGRVGEDFPLL